MHNKKFPVANLKRISSFSKKDSLCSSKKLTSKVNINWCNQLDETTKKMKILENINNLNEKIGSIHNLNSKWENFEFINKEIVKKNLHEEFNFYNQQSTNKCQNFNKIPLINNNHSFENNFEKKNKFLKIFYCEKEINSKNITQEFKSSNNCI